MTADSDGATTAGSAQPWVTTRVGASGFRAEVTSGKHTVVLDEPESFGGTDMGPSPYQALLGAIGSCTAMTLRFYADRRKWPLEGATVRMRTSRTHAEDCQQCEKSSVGLTTIEREIELEGPLTDEQRQRLIEVADRCPVKQTLERGIRVLPAATA